MKPPTKILILAGCIAAVFLSGSGCQSPGVTALSSDTFVISKSSAAGAFTNMAKLRLSTIQEANEFASARNKVAVAVNAREMVPAVGFPSYEYQFRLVDKDDPAASGASLSPRPNVVIEKTEHVTAEVRTQNVLPAKPDVYTEIVKLDDLRKKGLITDAEYEVQKQKVLAQ